jgi:hypothetical protein
MGLFTVAVVEVEVDKGQAQTHMCAKVCARTRTVMY